MEDVKLVCLYGPESVGKTTLAQQLADYYNTVFVPEVARDRLVTNEFTRRDIVWIAYAQTQAVQEAIPRANRLLFCDTDLITTAIYSKHYLGEVPPIVFELEKQIQYDQYFLLTVEVPWIADGLRDLGHQRQEMYELFKSELEKRRIEYVLVSGDWAQRWETVMTEIDKLLF